MLRKKQNFFISASVNGSGRWGAGGVTVSEAIAKLNETADDALRKAIAQNQEQFQQYAVRLQELKNVLFLE